MGANLKTECSTSSFSSAKKDWRIVKLKEVSKIAKKQKLTSVDKLFLLTVKLNCRGITRNKKVTPKLTERGRPHYRHYAGDFLIGRQNFHNGGFGIVSRELDGGITSNAITCLSIDESKISKAFLLYQFSDPSYYKETSNIMRGAGQKELSDRQILKLQILLPSFEEQQIIARYLDWETSKISKLIKGKKNLISVLKEKRQNIISNGLTKSFQSNIEMKDSGFAWLGPIPEHWKLLRAKYIFRQTVSPVPPNAEIVTCFRDGEVTLRSNRRTSGFTNAILELGYQGIEPGKLVLHSMDAFAGAIGVSDSGGKCSPEYIICEAAISEINLKYFAALLRTLAVNKKLFSTICSAVRQRAPRVRFSHFSKFYLPVPPLEEQTSIINQLEIECANIDKAIKSTEREVELIEEFRTRLISDVVRGRIDVSSVNVPDFELIEANLDDQDEEEEAEDELITEDTEE